MLVGSTDFDAKRFLATAKAAGQDLWRKADWAVLHREYTFTVTSGTTNYAVPTDFGRLLTNTAWDRSNYREMRGGVSPADWQRLQSTLIASTDLNRSYRIHVGPQSGSIVIDPSPTNSTDTLVYEYVSLYWCESSGGTGQATWAADTDVIRMDEELFRQGWLWRLLRSMGMPYSDERNDYERAIKREIASDLSMPVTQMRRHQWDPNQPNCPEGDWYQ